MNIYLLSQSINYDTTDSCVVIAKSAKDAVTIYSNNYIDIIFRNNVWVYKKSGMIADPYDWVKPTELDKITVEYLGKASHSQKRGCIISSLCKKTTQQGRYQREFDYYESYVEGLRILNRDNRWREVKMGITATSKGITIHGNTYHVPNTLFNNISIVIIELLKKR